MKKILRTACILLVIFVAAVCVFTIQLNKKIPGESVPAGNPTLPVGYMMFDETRINEMFGYKQEMRELSERSSITPLGNERSLVFSMDTKGNTISSVYYQVTSLTDGAMVENGDIRDLSVEEGVLKAPFTIQTNIRGGQEYMLRMTVETDGGQKIYYYTRLLQISGVNIQKFLDLAIWFYTTSCDKATSDTVINYIEPDTTMSNRSLADVNLHSSLEMVGWGNLEPSVALEATPRIVEINTETISIVMEYTLQAANTAGNIEYYHAEDFYRMGKATDETLVLLNFERKGSLIFDAKLPFQNDTGMDLGIQPRNINYKVNEYADIAAFVLNGDLWLYNQYTGKTVRVFSFRQDAAAAERVLDVREEYTDHDIAIEQVSKDGDISFVVYGYMASGSHEGRMGVSVCYYSTASDTVTEKMFIPLNQSYSILSSNVSRLSYISEDNQLFLFLGTQLCKIDLTNGSYMVIEDSIPSDGFAVSDSQETVAWLNGNNEGAASKASIMNLKTGEKTDITAAEGEAVISCGFINEDFVYGSARISDIRVDNSGRVICGMYKISIAGIDGAIKKEYNAGEKYVTATVKEQEGIKLTISKLGKNGYQETGADQIVNNEYSEKRVTLVPAVYERTQEKMLLTFPQTVRSPDAEETTASIMYTDSGSETILEWPDNTQNMYYVYGGGKLLGIYRHENLAIQAADAASGVVLNSRQQYTWERGNWKSAYTIDSALLPEGVVDVGMDVQALKDTLGDSYEVLDLAGCSQESLKYMLAKGYPVIAKGREQTYLILGYDPDNIWVYRPGKSPKAIASDDSMAEFITQGNKFLTYMKK
ncbi:MAG: hypothetical protein Q4B22_00135 [Eubacteriales bacterium]|nr:hypothetical protein [Eubacteriales bacterium]